MNPATLPFLAAPPTVTWIVVEKPVFDLVGVVLYSLGLAGICAIVALVLGGAFGVALIVRSRRLQRQSRAEHGLQLLELHRS